MELKGKLSELLKVDFEAMTASTVAGTSTNVTGLYDMTNYERALLSVNFGLKAVAAITTMGSVVVDLVESSAASVAGTSACGGKVGIEIGSTINTAISATCGCFGMILQCASALSATGATSADTFRFGLGTDIVTFTFSSMASMIEMGATNTNIKSTVAYFGSGSVVGTTEALGMVALCDNLRNTLKSPQVCIGGPNVFSFTTPSSYQLGVQVINSTKGNIFYSNTMSTTRFLGEQRQIAASFDIRSDQMASTLNKRFIGLKWTTAAQAVPVGFNIIRASGRYMPDGFKGKLSS